MGTKISVCGKGGSGKSTLVGLLAGQAEGRRLSVLVVDSDESNSGLFRTLGFEKPPAPLMDLVGGKKKLKGKMTRTNILNAGQILIRDIPGEHIIKQNGLGLVSIGKIHRALEGCACPMGALTREFLKKLKLDENEIAIIDMEAGVEHFGRGIDKNVDTILLVVEPSFESIAIAAKIKELAGDMNKRLWAVLNKVNSADTAKRLENQLGQHHIKIIGMIPNDSMVFETGLEGRPFAPGKAFRAAGKVLDFVVENIGE